VVLVRLSRRLPHDVPGVVRDHPRAGPPRGDGKPGPDHPTADARGSRHRQPRGRITRECRGARLALKRLAREQHETHKDHSTDGQ